MPPTRKCRPQPYTLQCRRCRRGVANTKHLLRHVRQCLRRASNKRNRRLPADTKILQASHHRRISVVLRSFAGCGNEGIHRQVSCKLQGVVAAAVGVIAEDVGEAANEGQVEVTIQGGGTTILPSSTDSPADVGEENVGVVAILGKATINPKGSGL